MRVMIDGYLLPKQRGLGRYVRELLHALASSGTDIDIVVAVPSHVPRDVWVQPDVLHYSVGRSVPYPIWEQFVLPGMARKLKADVLHSPSNTAPAVWGKGLVMTIHDLMYMDLMHPTGNWYQKFGGWYRRLAVSTAIRRASALVAVSEKTSRDIAARFGRDSTVIPNCVSMFLETTPVHTTLEPPYLLHVGGETPSKNTSRCIQAFLRAAPVEWRLIVVGVSGEGRLARQFARNRVVFPGWLTDGQLVDLYKRADGLLFPSLEEGFGLPIIEAFGACVPVMTSGRDPMLEVAGGAACCIDPENDAEMEAAIARLVSDDEYRAALVEAGKRRYRDFNPQTMAQNMVAVYRRAAQDI